MKFLRNLLTDINNMNQNSFAYIIPMSNINHKYLVFNDIIGIHYHEIPVMKVSRKYSESIVKV